MSRATPIGPTICTGSTPSVIRAHDTVSTTVIAITTVTAQPKGSTCSTANATGTAHQAKDGAATVSPAHSAAIATAHAVGHQLLARSSPRVA